MDGTLIDGHRPASAHHAACMRIARAGVACGLWLIFVLVSADAAWSVGLTASKTSITPGVSSTLTATSTMPADSRLFIYDVTDGANTNLASCSTGTCSATVSMLWSENRAPKNRRYQARLFRNYGYSSQYLDSQSDLVTVEHAADDLSAAVTASPASIDPTQSAVLTAKVGSNLSSLPAYYRLFIYDVTDGASTNLGSCTTATCSVTVSMLWSENPSPKNRVYRAKLFGNYGYSSQYVESESASLTLEHRAADLSIALSASLASIDPTQNSKISASVATMPPYGRLKIYDVTDGGNQSIATCTTSTCEATVSMLWSENASPKNRVYRARLFGNVGYASEYLASESGLVTLQHRAKPFSVELGFGGTGPWSATASVSPSVSSTGHAIKIRAAAGSQYASCTTGTTCTTNVNAGTYYATVEAPDGTVMGRSHHWTIAGGQNPHDDGTIALALLAARFASPSAVCEELAFRGRTHVLRSTLNDAYLICEAGSQAGHTTIQVLIAVAGVSTAAIAVLAASVNRRDPGEPPPTDPPPPPPPGTSVPPAPPAGDYSYPRLLEQTIRSNNLDALKNVSASELASIVRECIDAVQMAGEDPDKCGTLPIFVSGSDTPTASDSDRWTTTHVNPTWALLNYEQGTTKPSSSGRQWYSENAIYAQYKTQYQPIYYQLPAQTPECPGIVPGSGDSCQEFPYWATEQGGPDNPSFPWLAPILAVDNTSQGTSYGAFVGNCMLSSAVRSSTAPYAIIQRGDRFINLPMPSESHVPTIATLCN